MKDERGESEQRRELMDSKVEMLKRQHGQLLPGKCLTLKASQDVRKSDFYALHNAPFTDF